MTFSDSTLTLLALIALGLSVLAIELVDRLAGRHLARAF